jgi:hypothetical protein
MPAPSDSLALLDAWEAALSHPEPDRAASLLVSLGWLATAEALSSSTVGRTDHLLFDLHQSLFGGAFGCVATCPACSEVVEFATSTCDLASTSTLAAAGAVSVLDGALDCRLPVNADLTALNRSEVPVDPRMLLRRCVLGDIGSVEALSDEECDRALTELAEADPGALIEIAIECPCGHRWVDEFDIRLFLLSELTEWAVRSLRDVHQLASRYGWSESAILRMSPWRKRIYLDACGET